MNAALWKYHNLGKIAYLSSFYNSGDKNRPNFIYGNKIDYISLYDDFAKLDLNPYETLVLSAHLDELFLSNFKDKIYAFLESGRLLISFISNYMQIIPNNSGYIQSKTPIKDREIILTKHAILEGIATHDINYRRGVKGFFNRGYFDNDSLPCNIETIMLDNDGNCIAYIDKNSTNGIILATAGSDLLEYGLLDNTTARKLGVNLLKWIESLNLKKTIKHISYKNPPIYQKFSHHTNKTSQKLKNAIITAGSSYHHYFFKNKEAKYQNFFNTKIYFLELQDYNLHDFDYIVISSRVNAKHLKKFKNIFREYLKNGGTIVAFNVESSEYLPNIRWQDYEVNFWWWLTRGADLPLYPTIDGLPLFKQMDITQAKWHYHGAYYPPKNSKKILVNELQEAIIYKDETLGGMLFVTSLDPDYHFGQGFMPKTEGFFDNFMNYIQTQVELKKNV